MAKYINCKNTGKLLTEYAENVLPENEQKLVKIHIESCPACKNMLEDILFVLTKIKSIEFQEPSKEILHNITTRTMEKIMEYPESKKNTGVFRYFFQNIFRWKYRMALVTATLILAGIFYFRDTNLFIFKMPPQEALISLDEISYYKFSIGEILANLSLNEMEILASHLLSDIITPPTFFTDRIAVNIDNISEKEVNALYKKLVASQIRDLYTEYQVSLNERHQIF